MNNSSYIKNRRYDSELLIDFNLMCFFLKYKYRQTNCFSGHHNWQLSMFSHEDNLDVDILKEREKLSPANIHMIDHKADKIVYSNKWKLILPVETGIQRSRRAKHALF